MFEMIALILQRIERLIFDLPAPASCSHHPLDGVSAQRQVADPGPSLDLPLPVALLIEQIVNFHIHRTVAKTEIVAPSKVMLNALRILPPEIFDLPASLPTGKLTLQTAVGVG